VFLLYSVVVDWFDVIVRGKTRDINGSLPEILYEKVTFRILLVEAVDTDLLRVYRMSYGSAVYIISIDVQHATEERSILVGELLKGFFLTALSGISNGFFHESDHLFFCRNLWDDGCCNGGCGFHYCWCCGAGTFTGVVARPCVQPVQIRKTIMRIPDIANERRFHVMPNRLDTNADKHRRVQPVDDTWWIGSGVYGVQVV